MLPGKTNRHRILPRIVLGMVTLGLVGMSLAINLWAQAAGRSTVVVFEANWCASCREVIPVVREIAGQNGLGVQEIDVDAQNAPAQARSYGLNIPTGDLPQVYLVTNGSSSVLFDGRNYRFGKTDVIRATVLQNLRQSLGSGVSGR